MNSSQIHQKIPRWYGDGLDWNMIDCEIDGDGVVPHVQWSNGMKQWRYNLRELEVICK